MEKRVKKRSVKEKRKISHISHEAKKEIYSDRKNISKKTIKYNNITLIKI
jgi:hypothetical protein